MADLIRRLWHALAGEPATPERTAAQEALIRARIRDDDEPRHHDRVTDAEVRRALEWLYAPHHERRARQRRRRAITYRQRDQVAAILLRLVHMQPTEEDTMTQSPRETWIKTTIAELNRLAVGTTAEATDFAPVAEEEAREQEDEWGDDVDAWDAPADIADRISLDFGDIEMNNPQTNPTPDPKAPVNPNPGQVPPPANPGTSRPGTGPDTDADDDGIAGRTPRKD